jgi:hypothetical protein
VGDDIQVTNDELGITIEGTVVQENDKTYWFKDEFGVQGQQVPPLHAVALLEGIAGRKLTDFEFKLLISKPLNGRARIAIVSMLVGDYMAYYSSRLIKGVPVRDYLQSVKRQVIGYIIMARHNKAGYNWGEVIGRDAFYDTDGNQVGHEILIKRSDEPGLETPLIDPIDILAGYLADLVLAGAKAFLRSMARGIEEKLLARGATPELAKLAALTEKELKAVRGGTASRKPPLMSAEELNKPVPQTKDGIGPKNRLTPRERTGVMKILNVLERVRNGESWAWVELIGLRIKRMEYGKWAEQGWFEIDVLPGNPGALNRVRLLIRWVPGDIEVKLRQVH